MDRPKNLRWRTIVLVGLIYLVLVILMTWPAIRHLNHQLIGNNIDNWIFYWNNWWLGEALSTGQNWFQTSYLFHPSGTNLVAHSHSFLSSMWALVLEPLTGPVAAYNLVLLVGLWLSAVGMFLLVQDITQQKVAALLSGFIYAFAPYHLSQALSHVHLGSIHWWPFYVLFLRRALYGRRRRDGFLAGLFGALTLWSGLQLGIFLALWTVTYLGWFLWRERRQFIVDKYFRRHSITLVVIVALITLLLSVPILGPVVANWSDLASTAAAYDEGLIKQTDILAYWVPPTYHPLWGDAFNATYERFVANRSQMPYIGFGAAVLAVLGIWGWRKEALFWFLSMALWLLLAAGSALRFNGTVLESLPLPFRWLGTTFPLAAIRAPDRFNLLVVLSLAILTGLGAAYLWQQDRWRWVLVPLSLVIAVEYLAIPIPRWDLPPVSSYLADLRADNDNYAVIDYPMGYQDSKLWLYYQTIHGKPTVEGHVSRYTTETYSFVTQQPLLKVLYESADKPEYLPEGFFAGANSSLYALGPAMRDLQANGIYYILLHRPYLSPEGLAKFRQALPLIPIYEDGTLAVFDFENPRPVQYGEEVVSFGTSANLVQATSVFDPSESELRVQLLTQVTALPIDPATCRLQFDGGSSAINFQPIPEGSGWQRGDLANQHLNLPVPGSLPPGQYGWSITCPDGSSYRGPDYLWVDGDEPTLLRQQLSLQYEPGIQLQGYRWWTEGAELHLSLLWQTTAEITKDYKLFVHLLDENGAIMTQYDAVPCAWGCPTSQWQAGERVVDEAVLSLIDVPAGTYELAIGLYDASSGQRLPVQDERGQSVPDAYYILPEPFIIVDAP